MNFTDIFIRRPVLATVVSLMILALGLRAIGSLPVLQYPRTQNAVVTMTTTYYGADPDVIAGFITTPLENAIAQANGIDYMSSASHKRRQHDHRLSPPELRRRQGADRDQYQGQLGAQPASRRLAATGPDGEGRSDHRCHVSRLRQRCAGPQSDHRLSDPRRAAQAAGGPRGADRGNLLGGQNFALRAWLDPDKLAAYGLTAADVSAALTQNNYISGLGTTKGQMVQVNLTASTGLHTEDEFANLIIKQANGAIVRLKDVANVTLGADSYETRGRL